LCFWKRVVSHWSVEGRPHRAQPTPVMASNCSKQGACVQNCSYTPPPYTLQTNHTPKTFQSTCFHGAQALERVYLKDSV
jgi:hypothetical protein